MFNPLSIPKISAPRSPKRFTFPSDTAFYSQLLTVLFALSLFSLYRFQGSQVPLTFSVFFRGNSSYYSNIVEFCQAILATSSRYNTIL